MTDKKQIKAEKLVGYNQVLDDIRFIHTVSEQSKKLQSVSAELLSSISRSHYIDLNPENNKARTSSVLNTLTLDCFLNAFSSDHIAPLEASAKAKYCTSLLCGANLPAASANMLNSLNGRKSTSSFMNLNTFESSSDESLLLSNISSRCLPISKNKYSGEISQSELRILFSKNTSNALPFDSNEEKTLFASTTKNIKNQPFKESLNLCANDLSTFSDSSATSFSVSLLFDTIDFNSINLSTFCLINFLTTDGQFTLNSSISSFSSLDKGTLNSDSGILASPKYNNENDYLNVAEKDIIAHNTNIDNNAGTGHASAAETIQQVKTPAATGHSLTGGAGGRGEVRIWSYG